MYVIKRDGTHEEVHFDKITARIRNLCGGLDENYVNPVRIMPVFPIYRAIHSSKQRLNTKRNLIWVCSVLVAISSVHFYVFV